MDLQFLCTFFGAFLAGYLVSLVVSSLLQTRQLVKDFEKRNRDKHPE